MPAINIKITGHVQGVFFRAGAVKKAFELNVKGWVHNANDGSVEIHAEGEELKLLEFEDWCHRGPPAAEVERVIRTPSEDEHCKAFKIVY